MAPPRHIVLTSHGPKNGQRIAPIVWGAATAEARGPVIGSVTRPEARNVIGTH